MTTYKKNNSSLVGINTAYKNIRHLLQDRQQLERLVSALDIPLRKLTKDDCGQWSIIGHGGFIQSYDGDLSYVLYFSTYSERKWSAIKRAALGHGLSLTQDGDEEGCFRFRLPSPCQAAHIRRLLKLRKKAARPLDTNTA